VSFCGVSKPCLLSNKPHSQKINSQLESINIKSDGEPTLAVHSSSDCSTRGLRVCKRLARTKNQPFVKKELSVFRVRSQQVQPASLPALSSGAHTNARAARCFAAHAATH
jgi:hypothetical protein